MSSNKEKASQRRKNEHRVIANRNRDHKARYGTLLTHGKKGKLRKVNAFTCGIPKCSLCCNPRRVSGAVTLAEVMVDYSLKEALADLD